MSLIRSGMARRLCGNGWAQVLRELHHIQHDLRELMYLHAVRNHLRNRFMQVTTITPFSSFEAKDGYAGFSPSSRYISDVYNDFIKQIRPILDQCVASLPGSVLKWDHSFKASVYSLKVYEIIQ